MARYRKFGDLQPEVKQEYATPGNVNIYDSSRKTNHGNVHVIKSESEKHRLIMSNEVVCIDIMATWCQPCKEIAPHFANIADIYAQPGKCVFAKENVELGLSPTVSAVPCFHLYKKGKLVHSESGGNMRKIEELVKKLL